MSCKRVGRRQRAPRCEKESDLPAPTQYNPGGSRCLGKANSPSRWTLHVLWNGQVSRIICPSSANPPTRTNQPHPHLKHRQQKHGHNQRSRLLRRHSRHHRLPNYMPVSLMQLNPVFSALRKMEKRRVHISECVSEMMQQSISAAVELQADLQLVEYSS